VRNYQDRVLDWAISPSFAFGVGSGHDGHVAVLVHSFAIMWMHSVVGTLVMVAGFLQFSERLRVRATWLHRLFGYLFIIGSWIVATTAMAYLVRTPDTEVFSGRPFSEILWLLAIGTVAATTLALAAIIRRDPAAHREYVTYAFAMIMSAALLRIGWITVAHISHMDKEQINLTEAAYAGPILFLGAAIYLSKFLKGRRRRESPMVTPRANVAFALAGVVGLVVLAVAFAHTDWDVVGTPDAWVPGRTALAWSWWIPLPAYAALMACLAAAAKRRGDLARYVAWRTWFNATLASPLASAGFLAWALVVHHSPLVEAWWAASIGWALALFAVGLNHARVTTHWAQRRTSSAAVPTEEPVLVTT
jgi:hypothetical protein